MNGLQQSEIDLMGRRLPMFCVEDTDRHGNVRLFFRKDGKKTRIRAPLHSLEFNELYGELRSGSYVEPIKEGYKRSTPQTWRWACEQYFSSDDFLSLDPTTRTARRLVLEGTYRELLKQDGNRLYEELPISALSLSHLEVLRDRKRSVPHQANNRVKAMRGLSKFIKQRKWRPDLARDLERLKTASKGHAPWLPEWIKLYQGKHPAGSEPRRALALFLYTGVRVSDVVRLGRQHERLGELKFTCFKNRNRAPIEVEIPILAPLRAELAHVPEGQLLYLQSMWGKPYSTKGFSNKFKRWCKQAGLPSEATCHGLRKASAAVCAEGGATENEMMAIFGWRKSETAQIYLRGADRKKMASRGMQKMKFENE